MYAHTFFYWLIFLCGISSRCFNTFLKFLKTPRPAFKAVRSCSRYTGFRRFATNFSIRWKPSDEVQRGNS